MQNRCHLTIYVCMYACVCVCACVCACVGYFAVDSSVDVPCLIYVTLDNRLVVYPNVQIGHMEAGDLVDRVRRTPLVHSLYEQLGLNCGTL
jgi:hypothetical protein